MAALIDEPTSVTPTQMDRWCTDFDNWGICDTVCFVLFDRTPHAWSKVAEWAESDEEFVKRAAFALLASLAGHDKKAVDQQFLDAFPLIERAAPDGRNFVKKGVSWALRRIGHRNPALRKAAMKLAQRLAASKDPAARCVVLTGTGRAFCVGQDLKEHIEILNSESSEALFRTVDEHYNPIVTALASMPKPVLAAVNGVAAGAGASLAFACDLRILADTAGFNLAFANVALSCDTGASYHLQRLVGRAKAIELLYFPRTISADGAVTEAQGYLFSPPVPAVRVRQLLNASHGRRPPDGHLVPVPSRSIA